jgi:hypothetical protein
LNITAGDITKVLDEDISKRISEQQQEAIQSILDHLAKVQQEMDDVLFKRKKFHFENIKILSFSCFDNICEKAYLVDTEHKARTKTTIPHRYRNYDIKSN